MLREYIRKVVVEYGAFFVFMYTLGMVCTLTTVPHYYGAHPYVWAPLELVGDVLVISLLLALLPLCVGQWIKRFFYVLFYVLTIVDVFCFVKFEATINPTILLLLGETNAQEAAGFFETYLTPDVLFSDLGWVLLVLLVHILWSIALKARWRVCAKVREFYETRIRKFLTTDAALAVSAVAIIGLMTWSLTSTYHNKVAMRRLLSYDKIGNVEHELTRKDRTETYLPLYRLVFSIYANNLTSQQLDVLINGMERRKKEVVSLIPDSLGGDRCPNIVLIIGESYNKRHSQLYGYHRPTTPRQLRRYKRGEIIPFTDVVAPWNLTSFVFKHLFSLYAVGDTGEWCDYPMFPELFRKGGYHVSFLTNQFLPKAKEQVYDFSGGFFLNNPTLSKTMFDSRNENLHIFDDGLLKDYDDIQDAGDDIRGTRYEVRGANGELTIFHLIGQHTDYRVRCPKSRMPFKRDDYKDERPDLYPRELQNLAYYDCGTWFNDSVVDQIIRRVENDDAVVIYLSDHGEEIYGSKGVHFVGRMHSTEITYRLAHEEFEIPMWIWTSRKFRRNHPQLVRQIRRASKRRYMSDALAHTLLYLGGIDTKYYRPDLNVLDTENYNENRPRLLRHDKDYDILREKANNDK